MSNTPPPGAEQATPSTAPVHHDRRCTYCDAPMRPSWGRAEHSINLPVWRCVRCREEQAR